ncbi:hypothetical protein niasHT_007502 [Heterodera trifolii]|uniref:Uncharacterized protein n=1 Tax=Heterodera trifolii TaxID=157864 RepID=A0ABD2LS31_9BILA
MEISDKNQQNAWTILNSSTPTSSGPFVSEAKVAVTSWSLQKDARIVLRFAKKRNTAIISPKPKCHLLNIFLEMLISPFLCNSYLIKARLVYISVSAIFAKICCILAGIADDRRVKFRLTEGNVLNNLLTAQRIDTVGMVRAVKEFAGRCAGVGLRSTEVTRTLSKRKFDGKMIK